MRPELLARRMHEAAPIGLAGRNKALTCRRNLDVWTNLPGGMKCHIHRELIVAQRHQDEVKIVAMQEPATEGAITQVDFKWAIGWVGIGSGNAGQVIDRNPIRSRRRGKVAEMRNRFALRQNQ